MADNILRLRYSSPADSSEATGVTAHLHAANAPPESSANGGIADADMLRFGDPRTISGTVIQTAFTVADVEAAALRWIDTTGAGPFFFAEMTPSSVYRGCPTRFRVRIAIGFLGAMNIELVQPLGGGHNIYADAVAARGYGLHHLNLHTNDIEGDIARHAAKGIDLISLTEIPGVGKSAFLDTVERLGHYIELTSFDEPVNSVISAFRSAHLAWDGTDPIRLYPTIEGLNA